MEEKTNPSNLDSLSVDDTLKALQSSPDTGLTLDEANQRISQYGRNEVAERPQNPAVALLKNFRGLTAWMLEIAIVLSFVLGIP